MGEEIALLKQRVEDARRCLDASLHATRMLLSFASCGEDDIQPGVDSHLQSVCMLRYSPTTSHTHYDEDIGYLCSAWESCMPASSFAELKARGSLSVEKLYGHCECVGENPSEWISMVDDVTWMLDYLAKKCKVDSSEEYEATVSLIWTLPMDRLNILYGRSDKLVAEAGGHCYSEEAHPEGVMFAWWQHYLVYGWIPTQCRLKTWTVAQFREACAKRDILKSTPIQITGYKGKSKPSWGPVFRLDPAILLCDPPEVGESLAVWLSNMKI